MSRIRKTAAAGVLALGLVAGMAPAAGATTCEAILGNEACAQFRDTVGFVMDTAGSAGPIVDEQRDRVAALGKQVTDLVWCVVDGSCI